MAESDMNEEMRLRDTVQSLKEDVVELQNKAAATLKDLREKGQVYKDQGAEVLESMAQYCNENPQRAALIAGAAGLGAGLILGMLMRGK